MATVACPICKHTVDPDRTGQPYWPFCSRRCKTIDLSRWLGEGYGVRLDEEDAGSRVPPRGEGST